MEEETPGTSETNGVKRSKGIYLLPNLFTTAGLFAGFYAIVAAMGGRFEPAAIAVFIAMIMDGLDGRVARLTNAESDFGKEYDSLADMVSFGLAPALVVYVWSLSTLGKIGWLAAFVYAAAAALRLARFNTRIGSIDKRYFQGLASPAAAGLVAGLVWMCDDYGLKGKDLAIVAFCATVAAGMLMVSNIYYLSFKELDLKNKVPFFAIVFVMVIFVVISLSPPQILFMVFLIYACSGPVSALYRIYKKHRSRAALPPSDVS